MHRLLLITCIGIALLLSSASLAPFALLKSHIDAHASQGVAEIFTPLFLDRLKWIARLLSGAFIAAAGLTWLARYRLNRYLHTFTGDFRTLRKSGHAAFHTWMAADGAHIHISLLIAFTVVGTALRLSFAHQPITWDEAITVVRYAWRPPWVIISWYAQPNNHVFHTLLVHFSISVLGSSDLAIRLPALLAGILCIPVAYLVALLIYNRHVALIAAALTAAAPPMVAYSTIARGYSLVTLFFLIFLGLSCYARHHANRVVWLALVVVGATGFYCIPTMLYPIAFVTLWITVSGAAHDSRLGFRPLLTHQMWMGIQMLFLTAFLYLPIVMVSGLRKLTSNRFVRSRDFSDFLASVTSLPANVWRDWHLTISPVLLTILCIGAAAALLFHHRVSAIRIPVWTGLFSVAILIGIQRVVPYERVFSFLIPLFWISAAAGLWLIGTHIVSRRAWVWPLTPLLACVLGLAFGYQVFNQRIEDGEQRDCREASEVVSFLKQSLQAGDSLIGYPLNDLMSYYSRTRHFEPYSRLEPHSARRMWLIANTRESAAGGPKETITDLLRDAGLADRALDVQIVRRFPSVNVYQLAGH